MEHLENVPPSLRLELRKPSVKGMGYRHNIPVSTIGEAADVDMSLEASGSLLRIRQWQCLELTLVLQIPCKSTTC